MIRPRQLTSLAGSFFVNLAREFRRAAGGVSGAVVRQFFTMA